MGSITAEPSLLEQVRALKAGAEAPLNVRALQEALAPGAASATFVEKLGHLLADVPPARLAGRQPFAPVRIGIVSNCNCDAFAPLLRALLLAEEIAPEFYVGDYNQFVGELLDPASGLKRFDSNVTICVFDEHYVFDGASGAWSATDLLPVLDERATLVEQLVASQRSTAGGVLILNTIPLSYDRYATVIGCRERAQLSKAWRDFNARLLSAALQQDQTVVIDGDLLLQRCRGELRDSRLVHRAGMYLSLQYLYAMGREVVSAVRATLGRAKKCLVLDLDNTLWGGAIGEDGVAGIALGPDVAGRPYVVFQETVRTLQHQGVLLAINSKNDPESAAEAFTHPSMVLTQEDFVHAKVNWRPKSDNITEIAASLNLGVDSFVFFDDERFERNLVKSQVPGVAVIDVPADPSDYVRALLDGGWFTTITTTDEDRVRTASYRRQARRDALMETAASFEEYLHRLDIQVALVPPTEFSLPRLTQLNLRTNQFNMTTRRFQGAEMQAMAADPAFAIYGIEARDKFGDYGLIGSVIVEKSEAGENARWHIRNLLLSCRVLARGIEGAALRFVLADAKRQGAVEVRADYIPTARNAKYKTFYTGNGFAPHSQNGNTMTFRHDLHILKDADPWITLVCANGGEHHDCVR
jgi:FkbH-like protein